MNEKEQTQTEKSSAASEFLNAEREGATRHELSKGRVLAKASSNRVRSLIASNTTIAIGNRIQVQRSEIYAGGMMVRIAADRFSYPDIVIVGEKPSFLDEQTDVLLNPTVILEVYSKNSNTIEKTEKLEHYLAMDSIREYLQVKEDEMRVEHYFKQNPKQWIYRIYNDREEIISLESVNCKISMMEMYAQINFSRPETKASADTKTGSAAKSPAEKATQAA